MNEMIEDYQAETVLRESSDANAEAGNTAVIGEVFEDGSATLIFAGDTGASQKRYRCNEAITFSSGERVHLARECGTVIVEYPIYGYAGKTAKEYAEEAKGYADGLALALEAMAGVITT